MNEWITQQVNGFQSLSDRHVNHWQAVEMALRGEGSPEEPLQFRDPAVPFLQLCVLYLQFEKGENVAIHTYQDDDEFGLCLEIPRVPLEKRCENGIYRFIELFDLPNAKIKDVRVNLNDRENVSEVTFFFEDAEIMLVAGEAQEEWDGSLTFRRFDESILLFPRASDFGSVHWYESSKDS